MLRAALTTLLFAVGLAGAPSAQTPTWKVEFLGTPPPSWSSAWAVAVNDDGLAVGNTYLSGYRRAWIAGPSQALELLPVPDGTTYTQAFDINSSGVVAGYVYFDDGTSRGLLWRPGSAGYEVFLLPSGPGGVYPFDARGINDIGDVVGKFGILGGSYHWDEATGVTQITTAIFPTIPSDVNEPRQIVGGSYRMDLDTFVLEDLGNPTETSYHYVYTDLGCINDAGECAGYAVVATSGPPYLAVRYTDGPVWKLFNSFPWTAAGASGLAASGDTVYQLGAYFGMFVYVEGFGSIELQNILDPAYAAWDVAGSFSPAISRGGRLACTGANASTAQSGVVLLTPLAFEDLGGAARGALGDPVLSGYGTLVAGEPTRLRLASGAPNRAGILAWSATSNPIPLFGGTFYANPPDLLVPFQTDARGRFELTFDWPAAPPGATFYLQAAVLDPEAQGPVSLSNALQGVTR